MAVVRAVEMHDWVITSQSSFLVAMARISAPMQPSAAASVGVAMPARIVPITVRIRPNGGTKFFMVMANFSATVAVRSSLGIGGPISGLM